MNLKYQITKTMKKIILLSFIGLLSACSNYKLEVQQGNLVTQKSIAQLQRGMTKKQVQALLGTPLMTDSFNANRWDYVFYQNTSKTSHQSKNITVFFQDNQLVNIGN
ncbi:MAG TPA: outer membrane protein assembly factor BamE [Leucothrix mucor]|uniref:Outer membrane protein assembly factor BamE n=1 Tax=Leucothrix mucor TaxID=45248 RepID=A0A7V2T219_LEUMU|nr:outer membrane protein assembly factor BamE [Leucothrix mucor]